MAPARPGTQAGAMVLAETGQQGDAEQHELAREAVIVGGALVVAAVGKELTVGLQQKFPAANANTASVVSRAAIASRPEKTDQVGK